jgi:hypothetical protein
MRHARGIWIVALLGLLLGASVAAASEDPTVAAPTEASSPADVSEPASPTLACAAAAAATEVDEEPVPHGICNCNPENEEADCKRVCGDAGGSCLVTIPCEDPLTYSGWCYCNSRGVEPIGQNP